jgi:2-keto-4-pentenoate hydratase/2-oxohepta-3-ene-1,7-dioic acid hydratase in catechol pathway
MGFRLANIAGRAALVLGEHWYDLEQISGFAPWSDPLHALGDTERLHELSAEIPDIEPSGDLATAEVLAPVPAPRSCFAVGLNYPSHASEAAMAPPDVPLIFAKFTSCIAGPKADVELRSTSADHEAELVVVIGPGGRDISVEDAWGHVAGLTVGQDISDRTLQFASSPPHFDLGKSRDGYGPIGPVLVSPDLFEDPEDLAITCEVNGVQRQQGRTSEMIFDVAHLVAYISSVSTLAPGDLIFTGTPDGVGLFEGRFLQPGDLVSTTISGIGTMENHCR